ncbi:hypothetical protein MMC30_000540 [Trapelia coarctata]|nr:hypothetical protein [Trapelia coarctata]
MPPIGTVSPSTSQAPSIFSAARTTRTAASSAPDPGIHTAPTNPPPPPSSPSSSDPSDHSSSRGAEAGSQATVASSALDVDIENKPSDAHSESGSSVGSDDSCSTGWDKASSKGTAATSVWGSIFSEAV